MTRRSRTRNYLAGLASGYTFTGATIVVGLWLTPFSLKFLDREQFAIFSLVSDVLIWLTLLDFGIASGLRLQAAQLTGRPDDERLNRLASTAFFAQSLVVLFMLAVGGLFLLVFPTFFNIRGDLQRDATTVMALMLVAAGLQMATRTFGSLLIANQQVYMDNLISLALIVVRTGLTVVLLQAGWGLISLPVASIAATVITSVLAIGRTFRLLPQLRIRFRYFSWEVLRGTGRIGLWFTLGTLAGIIVVDLDRIVAAKVISVASVTTLSLTGRLYILSAGLLQQLTNTARPMLGQLLGKGKTDEAKRIHQQLFVLSTGLSVVAAASIWAANGNFVQWWVGRANYGGIWLDLALALNLVVNSWVLPNRATLAAGLYAVPQHALSRVAEAALNLSISVALGLKFGLVWVALSTAIAGILTSCWYLPKLTAGMFKARFLPFLWHEASRPILVGLILAPLAWAIRSGSDHIGGLAGAVLAGTATLAIGVGLLWLLAFDQELRARVLNATTRVYHALRKGRSPRAAVVAVPEGDSAAPLAQ